MLELKEDQKQPVTTAASESVTQKRARWNV